jgi:hypothetical protein
LKIQILGCDTMSLGEYISTFERSVLHYVVDKSKGTSLRDSGNCSPNDTLSVCHMPDDLSLPLLLLVFGCLIIYFN